MEWGSYCLVDRPDNCPEWFSLAAEKAGGWFGASPAAVGFAVLCLYCSLQCQDGTLCPTPAAAVTNWASAPCLSHPALTVFLASSFFCAGALLSWPLRHLRISHLGRVELSDCYSGERIFPLSLLLTVSWVIPSAALVRLDSQSLLQPTVLSWSPSERVIPRNKQDNFSTKVLYTLTFFFRL